MKVGAEFIKVQGPLSAPIEAWHERAPGEHASKSDIDTSFTNSSSGVMAVMEEADRMTVRRSTTPCPQATACGWWR